MFCASLRRRPPFAPICNNLTLTASGGLQENQLTTHDIAIPSGTNIDPRTGTKLSARHLRILLFAPSAISDKNLEATIARIKGLLTLPDVEQNDHAIIFLLCPPRNTTFHSAKFSLQTTGNDGDGDTTAGVLAYIRLQVELRNHKVPPIAVLPLCQLDSLPSLIQKHAAATSKQRPKTAPPSKTTRFELLTQCTAAPPMQEQTAYVCTDIFKDLRDLAQSSVNVTAVPALASSSPSVRAAGGRNPLYLGEGDEKGGADPERKVRMLRDMVGEEEGGDVVDFWREEFVVE